MEATITVNMDNAAFEDGNDGRTEVSNILRELAHNITEGNNYNPLRDANGNTVGRAVHR